MTVIVMRKVTDAERRAVARFLSLEGLASREQMRAFLAAHGSRGLDVLMQPKTSAPLLATLEQQRDGVRT